MATKPLLADLVALYQAQAPGVQVLVESVGGVDAAKRVQAGEAFDGVVLASDAIDKLVSSGHVLAGSRVDLVRSGVAVAVPAGQPVPDISTEAALKAAVLAAPTLGYSTGPSGVQLAITAAHSRQLIQALDFKQVELCQPSRCALELFGVALADPCNNNGAIFFNPD
jgi:ABC-type molybdate transport system substrate-binding protein